MKYVLPLKWARIGISIDSAFAKNHDIFNKWNISYHGSNINNIQNLINSKLTFILPNNILLGGYKHNIISGHIKKPFNRFNKFTKKIELFNPNHIFTSPSILYSGNYYSPSYKIKYPGINGKMINVKFALQLRQRPESFQIGQETIAASMNEEVIDKFFNNNEIEWYTQETLGIAVSGLLVKWT